MVFIHPVPEDESERRNYISWVGDESERRICELCKTTKLNRAGRFYVCNTCGQRFAIADMPEEIHVDRNVSKLDVKPAIVFKQKTNAQIRKANEEELRDKYGVDNFDDEKVLKRPGVTIKEIHEHY